MSNDAEDSTTYVERTESEAHKRTPPSGIQGWGADLDPGVRPAVPKERTPQRFVDAHWDDIEPQADRGVKVLHSNERPGLTPIYGTAQPPSGVSGMIRHGAFRFSENDLRHWLMLMFADRVNVVEGIIEDLAHGHVPNIFKEMGGPAEWKYNRQGFIRKAVIAGSVVGLLLYLNSRRSRR
ncbi:MAG: hypothetical protein K0S16_1445 [Moraxellaceae bacterium]|jgi:hypothetical protein|nr:hypothetical protein [Moraxellaceae bacterium]